MSTLRNMTGLLVILAITTLANAQPGRLAKDDFLLYGGAMDRVIVSGTTAYTLGDYGLMSIDITDVTRPEMLAATPLQRSWIEPLRLRKFGDILYVIGQTQGLRRFDVSDPRNLTPLDDIAFPSITTDVLQNGDRLYVTTRSGLLYLVSLTDGDDLRIIDSLQVNPEREQAGHLGLRDTALVFISTALGNLSNSFHPSILTTISIVDANRVELISSIEPFDEEIYGYDQIPAPVIIGNLVIICSQTGFDWGYQNAISCVDISDPANPVRLWVRQWDRLYALQEIDGMLFIITREDDHYFAQTYTLEDPADPQRNDLWELDDYMRDSYYDGEFLFFVNQLEMGIYAPRGDEGLIKYGEFRSITCIGKVASIGDKAIFACNDNSLRMVTVQNSERLVESYLSLFDHNVRVACQWKDANADEYIALSSYIGLLEIVRLEADTLRPIGSLQLRHEDGSPAEVYFDCISWDGGLVAWHNAVDYDRQIATGSLWVVSLENPAEPAVLGTLVEQTGMVAWESVFNREPAVRGRRVYFGGVDSFMESPTPARIVTIEDPTHPRIERMIRRDAYACPLKIEGDLLLSKQGIYRLDDPLSPTLLTTDWEAPGYAFDAEHGLSVYQSYNSFTDYPQLSLVNYRDPTAPLVIDTVSIEGGYVEDLDLDNGRCLALSSVGLGLYHYTGADEAREERPTLPEELTLAASPNPFNSTTTISFSSGAFSVSSAVKLCIYDLQGRLVADLLTGKMSAPVSGSRKVVWDAANMVSGVYLIKLEVSGETRTLNAILVR